MQRIVPGFHFFCSVGQSRGPVYHSRGSTGMYRRPNQAMNHWWIVSAGETAAVDWGTIVLCFSAGKPPHPESTRAVASSQFSLAKMLHSMSVTIQWTPVIVPQLAEFLGEEASICAWISFAGL